MLIARALISQDGYWQVAGWRGYGAAQGLLPGHAEWQWEAASLCSSLLVALQTEMGPT